MPAGKGSGDYGGTEVFWDDLIKTKRTRLNDFSKVRGTIKGINTILVIEYKSIIERVV